jgi:hypothetical protein
MSRFPFNVLKDETGTGLVELVVATGLSGVLGLLAFTTITDLFQAENQEMGSVATTARADSAAISVTRVLRSAVNLGYGPLLSVSPTSISFNSVSNSGSYGVTKIWASSGICPCSVWSQYSSGGSSSQPTLLAEGLAQPDIFSYFTTVGTNEEQVFIPASGTSTQAVLDTISLVSVTVTLPDPSVGQETVKQQVFLPPQIVP